MKKEISFRVKDIWALVAASAFSFILMLTLRPWDEMRWEQPFITIWYLVFLYPIIFGFWESLDGDLLIEGRTQKMGVVNSFVVLAILIAIVSRGILSWLCTDLIACATLFAAREYGRYMHRRLEKKYIGKEGVLLGDLPNMAKAQIGDKEIKVCSKEHIRKGTYVMINELKGTYKYVVRK